MRFYWSTSMGKGAFVNNKSLVSTPAAASIVILVAQRSSQLSPDCGGAPHERPAWRVGIAGSLKAVVTCASSPAAKSGEKIRAQLPHRSWEPSKAALRALTVPTTLELIMANVNYLLYESAVGYAVFEVVYQADSVGLGLQEVRDSMRNLSRFGKMVKLVNFTPWQ
jgi:hypothetical protein